jgi:hypothetical protein
MVDTNVNYENMVGPSRFAENFIFTEARAEKYLNKHILAAYNRCQTESPSGSSVLPLDKTFTDMSSEKIDKIKHQIVEKMVNRSRSDFLATLLLTSFLALFILVCYTAACNPLLLIFNPLILSAYGASAIAFSLTTIYSKNNHTALNTLYRQYKPLFLEDVYKRPDVYYRSTQIAMAQQRA